MNHFLLLAALFAATTLCACDKTTNTPAPAAATPAPTTIVVAGPAGPAGADGAPGASGAAGNDGEKGDPGKTGGDTVVVVTPQK